MARQKKKKIVKNVKVGLFNLILINSVNFFGMLFGTMFFKEQFDVSAEAAYAFTILTLFCVNFILFRYVVYRSRRVALQKQFFGYFVVTVLIRILEFLAFSRVAKMVDDYRLAVIVVTLGATTLRFFFFKYSVFKR